MKIVKFILIKIFNVIAIAWIGFGCYANITTFAEWILYGDWIEIAAGCIYYVGAIITLAFLFKTLGEGRKK